MGVVQKELLSVPLIPEALEGCFVTIRLTLQEDIASVNVLIEELPEMLVSKLEKVLKQEKGFKLQVVFTEKFKKY